MYSQGQAAARVVTNCSVHNTNKSEITSAGAGVVRWHLVRPRHEEGGQEEPQAGRGRHPQAGLHPGRDLGQGEAAEPRG